MGSQLYENIKASLNDAIRNSPRTVHQPAAVARHRCHMTQEEFARALGVSTATVQAWDQGRRKPGALAWKGVVALVRERVRD